MVLSIVIRSDLNVREQQVSTLMGVKNFRIEKEITQNVIKILKRDAPIKTGKFKNSIKAVVSQRRQAGGDFQGFVKIGPTVSYSRYVIKKTQPSPGRYVSRINRRLVNVPKKGMHPGTKANNFIQRAKPQIQNMIGSVVEKHYGSGKFQISRFFKRG